MPDNDPARTGDSDDLAVITEAAQKAGELALALQSQGPSSWQKSDATPVSNADLDVDRFLRRLLGEARPHYGWLSEESDHAPAKAGGRTFVVDPIDGTRAFLGNRDTWTVCVAVLEDEHPIAAAIARPTHKTIYSAARGRGARLDDAPIAVANQTDLPGVRLAGGQGVYRLAPVFDQLQPPASFVGATSMALRLCLVASGACDATVALSAKSDWDLAAGLLLVHEAGGRVTDRTGAPIIVGRGGRHDTVAAANPILHQTLVSALADLEF